MKKHFNQILAQTAHSRELAIDVFRGIAITAMILVNNPGNWGAVYAPLKHAEWHGWTPTDLIFPFFIFIVGVSVSLALNASINNSKKQIEKAFIRAVKLILLGLFLAAFYYNFRAESYDWWQNRIIEIRIPGVLQRLGVVYFICVLLALYCTNRVLVFIAIVGLAMYTLTLMYVPYSDGEQIYVGLLEKGNSLAAFIDHTLIGETHLYYQNTQPFSADPEGVLSTVPAVVSGVSGILVGRWWLQRASILQLIYKLVGVGALLTTTGLIWGQFHPINKALWTAPFVLLTSGLACLLLAGLAYCLDLKKWRGWSAPFVVFGANSILFFMFAGVVARLMLMFSVGEQSLKAWLYTNIYQPLFGDYLGSLMYAIVFLLISYAIFYELYKRRIFWKV